MTLDFVIGFGRQTLELILLLSLPPLLIGLTVGVLISIFQATTQIQEMTLTFVPKIIATFISIIIFGSWMLDKLSSYTVGIINLIPTLTK